MVKPLLTLGDLGRPWLLSSSEAPPTRTWAHNTLPNSRGETLLVALQAPWPPPRPPMKEQTHPRGLIKAKVKRSCSRR